MKGEDNDITKKLLIVIICLALLGLTFMYYYSVKIQNNDYCTSTITSSTVSTTQDYTITNNTYYSEESIEIDKNRRNYAEAALLCMTFDSVGSHEITVRDKNTNKIGEILTRNGEREECTEIPLEQGLTQTISILCNDCTPTSNVTIQESILESSTRQSSNGIIYDNKQSMKIITLENCRLIYKQINTITLIAMGIIAWVIGVLLLIKKGEEELNSKW